MTLSNYQYTFTPATSAPALTFGAGTPYIVESVEGLTSLPELRVQDDTRGYIDGMFSGRDFYSGRTVTFNILIIGNSTHNAQYYFNQFKQTMTPQTLGYAYALSTLTFHLPGFTGDLTMMGRVRAQQSTLDPEWSYGYINTTVEFYFPDPRYYDADGIYLPTDSTYAGSIDITNAGWATMCPQVYIPSPAASFTLSDTDSGNTMTFGNVNTSSDVFIDLLNRTVYQGGAYARNILVSQTDWISIPGNTTTTFGLDSGTMRVYTSNAYI